jgi:hypothetical protein
VLAFVEAFVENGGVDGFKLILGGVEGEEGRGMNEGIVPPRFVGGVAKVFIL